MSRTTQPRPPSRLVPRFPGALARPIEPVAELAMVFKAVKDETGPYG